MNKSTSLLLAIALLAISPILGFKKPLANNKETFNKIQWSETTHNFGDIEMGPDAKTEFVFKNKRKAKLVVQKVEPGCSCTISSFTSEAVKKNKKGSITATYKTEGKPGFFKKFIKVTFDDNTTQDLIITGNVIVKAAY